MRTPANRYAAFSLISLGSTNYNGDNQVVQQLEKIHSE